MASLRHSLNIIPVRDPVGSPNSSLPLSPASPVIFQKELTHKLHESKRLKATYYENWKKYESQCNRLEEELQHLKSLLEGQPSKHANQIDSDSSSEAASVNYAINTLTKEVSKATKVFTNQDTLLKMCLRQLDENLGASQKIQATANEYLEVIKVSELHSQKLAVWTQKGENSYEDNLRTGNSSPKDHVVAPSLYDEIKDFEDIIQLQKGENAIFVSDANIQRINAIKNKLQGLKGAIRRIGLRKTRSTKDFVLRKALTSSMFLIYN